MSLELSPEPRTLIDRLKRGRIARSLSLGDIVRMTRQARSAINRLENGQFSNPTLNNLDRYARALGWHIKLGAEPLADGPAPAVVKRKPVRD